ncbi:S8 family serine peptidase [Bowmanella denitrificans]|uniref:S8 family serine peptidase n=1 Tax=Bowmanella denitrificans TaxID=366582 RepID=UPI00155889CC|nr:S8 family serine peptidase [Bowmanella denitrificans]
MIFKKSLLCTLISLSMSGVAINGFATESQVSDEHFPQEQAQFNGNQPLPATSGVYIVQLKGQSGIEKAIAAQELIPSNQLAGQVGNQYNPRTPLLADYTARLASRQQAVAQQVSINVGEIAILHSFTHTFNGFSAKLSKAQVDALLRHPDVLSIEEDVADQPTTINSPAFLGLSGANGQHSLGIKGEDVIIGIVDSGIWPEHPSFADDGSYQPLATERWQGSCDFANDPIGFTCNNKLIGARYFNQSYNASSGGHVLTELGEFLSPRDADGHGTHVASTAGGNEVSVDFAGENLGMASGIAPRARVAMYKVCWNSDFDNGDFSGGCYRGDSMAAIDAAVADGVDVINYSISGSTTSLTPSPTLAKLRASAAGVFVSVSAGNSGPTASTVGSPAPWLTSVGMSSVDGDGFQIGNFVDVNSGALAGTRYNGIWASAAPAPVGGGLTGTITASDPVQGCDTFANAADMVGKIAVISRGGCTFQIKMNNAKAAGAVGMLVYALEGQTPISMGLDADGEGIPAVMVRREDGLALVDQATFEATEITLSDEQYAVATGPTIGSILDEGSSRGPNGSTFGMLKPDVAAPGVNILAGNTMAPMFGPQNQLFTYKTGTSMAAPHVAGLAALFKQQHPSWSPAAIKSALMTTARQDVIDEQDGELADVFGIGAGHVVPVLAQDPGLVYNAGFNDYLAFLCGLGERSTVASQSETNCNELVAAGFNTDASQLNHASISVGELKEQQTIYRTVTNVNNVASVYFAEIDMPDGVDVQLTTFDAQGNPTEDGALAVDAAGTANYALTFRQTAASQFGEWVDGSITWRDSQGHAVRSPLVVKAEPRDKFSLPTFMSLEMNRGRASFPVKANYSGAAGVDLIGMVTPFHFTTTVRQDADGIFTFNESSLARVNVTVPEGTRAFRTSIRAEDLSTGLNVDLDMIVHRCTSFSCSLIQTSSNPGPNEQVVLIDPLPRASFSDGDYYKVSILGVDLQGLGEIELTYSFWNVRDTDNAQVRMSPRVIDGRFNNATITGSLETGIRHTGLVEMLDEQGNVSTVSVVEVKP